MTNRGDARYCRACRHELSAADNFVGATKTGQADFLWVEGIFRQPPAASGGFLWLLSATGTLFRLSPREGAKPQVMAEVGAAKTLIGLNRFTVVNVESGKSGLGGENLIGGDPRAIYVISLVTGESRALYQAGGQATIMANATETESNNFTGVTATSEFYTFATRTSGSEFLLNVRYFSPERAMEQPAAASGRYLLGPVVGPGCIGFATEEELWIYDRDAQTASSFPIPRTFSPLFSRSSEDLNVPPGGMPFRVAVSAQGREAWIGGIQRGQGGLLYIHLDRNFSEFQPLPAGSCVGTGADGSLTINALDNIQFIGTERPPGRFSKLQPGMPVTYKFPYLGYFHREPQQALHRLSVFQNSTPVDAEFEDAKCNADSCCGIDCFGSDVMVSYLDLSGRKNNPGVKLAHWSLLG